MNIPFIRPVDTSEYTAQKYNILANTAQNVLTQGANAYKAFSALKDEKEKKEVLRQALMTNYGDKDMFKDKLKDPKTWAAWEKYSYPEAYRAAQHYSATAEFILDAQKNSPEMFSPDSENQVGFIKPDLNPFYDANRVGEMNVGHINSYAARGKQKELMDAAGILTTLAPTVQGMTEAQKLEAAMKNPDFAKYYTKYSKELKPVVDAFSKGTEPVKPPSEHENQMMGLRWTELHSREINQQEGRVKEYAKHLDVLKAAKAKRDSMSANDWVNYMGPEKQALAEADLTLADYETEVKDKQAAIKFHQRALDFMTEKNMTYAKAREATRAEWRKKYPNKPTPDQGEGQQTPQQVPPPAQRSPAAPPMPVEVPQQPAPAQPPRKKAVDYF